MELGGWLTPDEFWRQYDESESRVRESAGELPCFGVNGWSGPVAIGEWDHGSRPPVTVSLLHGSAPGPELQVRTTSQDPRRTVVFHRMMAEETPLRGTDDFLDRQRLLEAEPAEELIILVSGERVSFDLWRESKRWWAAGMHAGYGLVLEGKGLAPEPIALESVRNIEPYLTGSRERVRAARGEI